MGEDAALRALGKVVLFLWEKGKEEWKRALEAPSEYESLIDWIRVIDVNFVKAASSVQFSDEIHKTAIVKMEEFVSESRSAIHDYEQKVFGQNRILNKINCWPNDSEFVGKAKAAKEKLKNGLDILKTLVDALKDYSVDHAPSSSAAYRSSSIAYSEQSHKVFVGIKKQESQLFKWLTGDKSKSKMIFVDGAPGVGKTSLVVAVLRNPVMGIHFKYLVWIEDLRSCELDSNIQRALMKANAFIWDLTEKDGPEKQMELEKVLTRMKEEKEKGGSSWVLVLDDASKEAVFESLEMHLSQTCPSVLVTTRKSSLRFCSESYLDSLRAPSNFASPDSSRRCYDLLSLKLAGLSMDDSYELFKKKMPGMCECETKTKDDFESILGKCGGSPLAIHVMCDQLTHAQKISSVPQFGQWERWSRSLQFSSLFDYERKSSLNRMVTKCRDLPRDLQDSILYLSMFPLDCHLRYSTLMRLWIVEGFQKESLKKLVEYNFFQKVKIKSYEKIGTCFLSNVLHQIVISLSTNDGTAIIIAGQEEDLTHNKRRLSFHSKPNGELNGMRLQKLTSLHVSQERVDLRSLWGHVKKLKVLNLQGHLNKVRKDVGFSTLPSEILHLKYLTYLSLRDTMVEKIPDDIRKLENLETLDVKGTKVSNLPGGISKLRKLRHLLAYRSDRPLAAGTDPMQGAKAPSPSQVVDTDPMHGVNVPSDLQNLELLQTLCMIHLDPVKQRTSKSKKEKRKTQKKRNALLQEIGRLTNLQRLGVSGMRNSDVRHLFPSLRLLKKLVALRLIAAPEEKISISYEDVRELSKELMRVHLTGCLETQLDWISSLTSMVKLVLKGSKLTGDPLQHLQKLRHLNHLELQQAFDGTELRFTKGGFGELRFLGLDEIKSLRSITVETDALAVLETLSLARCTSLKPDVPHIMRPRKLKSLKLKGMSDDFKRAVEEKRDVTEHIKVDRKDLKDGLVEYVIRRPTNGAKVIPVASHIQEIVPLKASACNGNINNEPEEFYDCLSTMLAMGPDS